LESGWRKKVSDTTVRIEAKADHIEKISKAKPASALAQLIWNSVDADASNVEVEFASDEMGIKAIQVKDNGFGFPKADAEILFGTLGGSWKRQKATTASGRKLHGKEGQGRFKAFSLGQNVKWTVVYAKNGMNYEFTISGRASRIDEFRISDETASKHTHTGVMVEIEDLVKQFAFLDHDTVSSSFTPLFAPYLAGYPDVSITIDGERLEVVNQLRTSKEIALAGASHSFSLSIFEWKELRLHEMHFCDENGFPLFQYEKQIRGIGDYGYSAYLKSSYLGWLSAEGRLPLAEMEGELAAVVSESLNKLKHYFYDRYIEDKRSLIDKWKSEDVYPYRKEKVLNVVEDAERKVFDILALSLNDVIDDFDNTSHKQKKLQFSLLKQAVASSPSSMGRIIREVVSLPPERLEELSALLEDTTLSAIISTSGLISDRLIFLKGLEEIVFDLDLKKRLKERSQLHRILAENTWIFGNSYSLSVDDESLTEVLRKHKKLIGENVAIDEPVRTIDGKVGIVDLMLSRSIPKNHENQREHLIVELKAPKVVIGKDEIAQIQSYAFAVAKDERFRSIDTKWQFWLVSNNMDGYTDMLTKQKDHKEGVIFDNDDITVVVKPWSQIIEENKRRHEFVVSKLNLSISKEKGLAWLQRQYAQYLDGVIQEQA
jgi:hypothetical protein